MRLLDHLEQVLLAEAHWNVLDHNSRECLYAVENGMEIDRVVGKFGD